MIEPQQDGCLHWHIMLYSSVLSPELLERAAAASLMGLQSQIVKMLDSTTCTTVPCDIHQWYNDILSSVEHGSKHPRGAAIKVSNASSNYQGFISFGMKKIHTNGYAWSWILLQEGGKGKIHVLHSVQTKVHGVSNMIQWKDSITTTDSSKGSIHTQKLCERIFGHGKVYSDS